MGGLSWSIARPYQVFQLSQEWIFDPMKVWILTQLCHVDFATSIGVSLNPQPLVDHHSFLFGWLLAGISEKMTHPYVSTYFK